MLLPTMGYIDSTLDYLKSSLETVKSVAISTRDVLATIASIIGTIVDILGFIGFRVFILLMITSFILWFLNLVSPVSKKTNYFIGIGLVVWLAVANNMPTQTIVVKYIIIIVSPFVITFFANFLVNMLDKLYRVILKKISFGMAKINFNYLKSKNKYSLNFNDDVALLLSSDLPTLDQIDEIKELMKCWQYNLIIFEEEKISLVDNSGRIIFSNDSKINQFLKAAKLKNIKLLWFWSSDYGTNELLEYLEKNKKIPQTKLIIGSGDNSFILNFLQRKWGWEVIYGYNLKEFAIKENQNLIDNILEGSKSCMLTLVNDYKLEEEYILKGKIVGGNLSVLVNEFSSLNFLNFKNKILFLDISTEDKKNLYDKLSQLKNCIFSKNMLPKAIIFGNLMLDELSNYSDIIQCFYSVLKNKSLIPIFQAKNFNFIRLNIKCIIEYRNNEISLKVL